MSLDTKTQQILELRTGAAESAVRAGVLLNEIRTGKLYTEKGYKTFNEYLAKELVSMERSWAYLTMKVAENFTEAQAREFGIKPLACLGNLSREVFKDKKPAELLTGQHKLTDAEGVEHVLDFAQDHSVGTLKGLIATSRDARDQAKPAKPYSEALLPMAAALQAAAGGAGITFHLHEQKKKVAVELYGDAKAIVAAMKEVSGKL